MISFYQKNQTAIFVLCIFLSVFIGILAPRLMAAIPGLLGLLFVGTLNRPLTNIFPKKLTVLVLAIVGVCFVSVFYAPDVGFALERVGKIALILLPALLFIAVCRYKSTMNLSHSIKTLVIMHVLIALFLFYERISGHVISEYLLQRDLSVHHLNRAFVVFSLWSVLLLYLCRVHTKNFLSGMVVLCSAIALSKAESQTGQLSFIVGTMVLLFFPTSNKVMTRSLLAGVIAFSLLFPFVVTPVKKLIPEEALLEGWVREASIIHRLEVWQHSAQKTFEKPVWGHGIEALRFLKSNEWMEYQRADSILHSHNSALQIWVEFGFIGIFLACGFLFCLFRRIEKVNSQRAQCLYMTVLITCLCISFTGYGLWQSWQLGMFIFFAGLSVLFTRDIRLSKA